MITLRVRAPDHDNGEERGQVGSVLMMFGEQGSEVVRGEAIAGRRRLRNLEWESVGLFAEKPGP